MRYRENAAKKRSKLAILAIYDTKALKKNAPLRKANSKRLFVFFLEEFGNFGL